MQYLVHVLIFGSCFDGKLNFTPYPMARFGDFQPICTWTPSYPWCNLFYRQVCFQLYLIVLLLSLVLLASWSFAGIPSRTFRRPRVSTCRCQPSMWNSSNRTWRVYFERRQHCCVWCEYSRRHSPDLSLQPSKSRCWWVFIALWTVESHPNAHCTGRWELRTFLIVYLVTLPLQIVTNTSLLPQGSMALVVFTAIHAGLVVTLFWILIANAIVATQWIEDGTMASIAVCRLHGFYRILSYAGFPTAVVNHLHNLFRWYPLHLPWYRSWHYGNPRWSFEPFWTNP